MTIMATRIFGCAHVVAFEIASRRQEAARLCGAEAVVNPAKEDAEKRGLEMTDGQGFDLVVECAGIPATALLAGKLARTRGRVTLMGVFEKPAALDLTDIVFREKTITGSMSGYGMYEETIRMMTNPLFRPDALITGRIGLEHLVDTGYRCLLEEKDCHIKTLVRPVIRAHARTSSRGKGFAMQTITPTFHEMAQTAIAEIAAVLARTGSDEAERMCAEILRARRIACYGVGREGLMMRALCMRLMHLGLDAHFVGDMTTPAIGAGDLLIASAGPGAFSTVMALQGVAQRAGARVMIVTAQPCWKKRPGRKARCIVEPSPRRTSWPTIRIRRKQPSSHGQLV